MESERLANNLVDENIELIRDVFKNCPEFGEYILSKNERIEEMLIELGEIK